MANNNILYSLFGWYQPSPVNYTDEEIKRSGGTIAGLENALNSGGSKLTDSFKLSDDPVRQMTDLAAMAESSAVGPLLDVYAEESTQPDINTGKCLWYECNDADVEKDLNAMLDRINSEDYMLSIAFTVAGTGNDFRRILYSPTEGITHIVSVPNKDMRRIWDPTTRRLLGFRWVGQKPSKGNAPYAEDDSIFPPWDFLHFRRIYNTDTEYGVAILSKLYGLWRRLEMSIDQMVLYRIHTMPNRIAMFVDVGDQDINDAMDTLHTYSTLIRQKFSLNTAGISDSRYDQPALDSVLYIPVRSEENNTKIETLQGDKDVPDIPDIQELYKSLHGGARIPGAYIGHGEDAGGGLAQASLVSQDMRFARLVRVVRRPIAAGFYRLAQLHLAFKGKDPQNYQINVKMSRISSLEEEVNSAILEKQVSMAQSISQLCKDLEIPNRDIIDLVFREYLSVPRYFIDVAKLGASLKGVFGGGQEDGMGGGGMGGIGGGMGMMGDDGGLGDDFGDGAGDGSEPQGGSEGSQQLQDSKIRIFRTSKRQKSSLQDCIRTIRSFKSKLTEAKRTTINAALDKFSFEFQSALTDLSSLQISRKSSLIEGYHGDRLTTEPISVTTKTLVESMEGVNLKSVLSEGNVSESQGSSAHPSVSMVKRSRNG